VGIKWVAKLRAGCVPTRKRQVERGSTVPRTCVCYGTEVEDKEHIFFGCTALGTDGWQAGYRECFPGARRSAGVVVDVPAEWVEAHRCQLAAAIIPRSLAGLQPGGPKGVRVVARLHVELADRTAELMRRRMDLIAD